MGRIVALGGGEIGRPHEDGGNYPIETTAIDKEIIKLTKKNILNFYLYQQQARIQLDIKKL